MEVKSHFGFYLPFPEKLFWAFFMFLLALFISSFGKKKAYSCNLFISYLGCLLGWSVSCGIYGFWITAVYKLHSEVVWCQLPSSPSPPCHCFVYSGFSVFNYLESVEFCWRYGHFKDFNSSNPWTWDIFTFTHVSHR